MCLLVFAWRTESASPLLVAANRDERLDRPAQPFGVLQDSDPRLLGGRDRLAGGTWLAVNDAGVVAGLTNRPSPGGPDRTKRSRGELPLMLAGHRSAEEGVTELVGRIHAGQYNPAWMLVGDRSSLFYVELADDRDPVVHPLPPGIHILENVALESPSSKVGQVRRRLATAAAAGEPLWPALRSVLA
ncbi:MAG TPA: NRDE family protein, partial [Acidimicrobiales bacterium]|nr:NRDE family protein [Acidimicrobiales bacterium]